MKCIIMAAGYGTRLGELTKNTPKPLIDINGKPVIDRIIDHLKKYGITDIMVNTHYLPEQIYQHLGSSVLYAPEKELLGDQGTIRSLAPWLAGSPFMVVNGDTLTNMNLDKFMEVAQEHPINIIASMEEWTCTGVWIYPIYYFSTSINPVIRYWDKKMTWIDMGTPEGLAKARKFFK